MIKFVQARHYQKAEGRKIEGITIHTAETPEHGSVAENLQSWTAGPDANVSSWHYAVDNDSITQSVLEKDIAWHAGPANGWTIGIELSGKAGQNAAQWDDEYSRAVLENAARLVANLCNQYNIPIVRLSSEDLKAGKRAGIFGHVDVTFGLTGGKGHMDPGLSFPWDAFLTRVREIGSGEDRTPVIKPAYAGDLNGLVEIVHEDVKWLVSPVYIAPIGIGQAVDLAKKLGFELPSPGLVDAIWQAADLKIDAGEMVITDHDGTPATMDSLGTHARVTKKLAELVGDRALGRDFFLLAGAFKDVVMKDSVVGLYGWHRRSGAPIQDFYGKHALAWRDYSQGLRLVRRA